MLGAPPAMACTERADGASENVLPSALNPQLPCPFLLPQWMFYEMPFNQDLNGWDVSAVTTMEVR